MKQRLPFLLIVGVGFFIWRGAFGWLASDRELVWRFPVSYGEVRRVELQVWDEAALLKREERRLPGGFSAEPTLQVPLTRGPHRAVASLWLGDAGTPVTYQLAFDPEDDEVVVLDLTRAGSR